MIKENTILGMDLFSDVFKDALIFHIPHSKTEIPEQFKSDYTDNQLVEKEINLLTDFATDEIFSIDDTTKVVFPYSRVFCDVERLEDSNEEMFKVGRGFYYTKTDDGIHFRNNSSGNKSTIYNEYYLKHHEKLSDIVDQKIKDNSFTVIVDCHSFSNIPFKTDIEQDTERPDFCIGTDDYHTPKWLKDIVYNFLVHRGYSVKINTPYAGTSIPSKHHLKDDSVYGIMIEINRDLYMKNGTVDNSKVSLLNHMFSDLFNIHQLT